MERTVRGEGEGEGVVTCTLNSISRSTNSKGNTVKFMHRINFGPNRVLRINSFSPSMDWLVNFQIERN